MIDPWRVNPKLPLAGKAPTSVKMSSGLPDGIRRTRCLESSRPCKLRFQPTPLIPCVVDSQGLIQAWVAMPKKLITSLHPLLRRFAGRLPMRRAKSHLKGILRINSLNVCYGKTVGTPNLPNHRRIPRTNNHFEMSPSPSVEARVAFDCAGQDISMKPDCWPALSWSFSTRNKAGQCKIEALNVDFKIKRTRATRSEPATTITSSNKVRIVVSSTN